jgi:hypothetical protein
MSKPKGRRKLARSRCRREKDKKWVLKKRGWKGMEWILLAQEQTSGKVF